ncbi:hypothetical protein KIN20_005128 [Parelaphostrongylus tenuis]|uniref:Uncharacterized protein n=1 Tax=Parelaphostrongylus tenuis TaxID=148309 RepID=A0AAD5QH89_PARTN|nr:hypothetical protein KIN20_005128 [Parelaphostrongylus tenuis]
MVVMSQPPGAPSYGSQSIPRNFMKNRASQQTLLPHKNEKLHRTLRNLFLNLIMDLSQRCCTGSRQPGIKMGRVVSTLNSSLGA